MFAYGAGPCRARRPGHRAGQHLHASRPSGCSRASSASTPRPARPRSRSWPTTPPTPAYVAADLVSQAEHDPMAASVLVTDSLRARRRGRGRAGQAGRRRPGTSSASAPRWPGEQSGIVLVDDIDQGLDVVNAYAAEHLEIQTARRRRRRGRACATPARSSSARGRRCRWATTAPAPTTCCPTAGCACHSSGLSVRAFLQVGARRRVLPRRARRGRRPRRDAGRRRGPARPRRRGRASGSSDR